MLIQAEHVSYSMQGQRIINDISFSIKKGETVSVIGYNGSGKSTLLKLLVGVITPTQGTISVGAGVRVGYVPQKLSFDTHLPITVDDFIAIYNPKEVINDNDLASLIDINALRNTPLHGLSGGQLQKVLIANALLGQPDILLLDEPTAGLDVVAQEDFYKYIEKITNEHGISVVLVSHDIHTVYSKSDVVICIHKGMCCSGSPSNKEFSNSLQELLGGYVVAYLHTHDHTHDG